MPCVANRALILAVILLPVGCTQTPDRGNGTAVFVEDFRDRSGRPGIARSVTQGSRILILTLIALDEFE